MLRYSISILLLLLSYAAFAQEEEVVEEEPADRPTVVDSMHQLRIGFDVSKLLSNSLQDKRTAYEIELDYYHKKDLYLVLEGGWGNGKVNYPDLKYSNSNVFAKLGINKSLFPRMTQKDWDMAFIGVRYGMGFVQRSSGQYSITDSLFGTVSGTVPSASFNAQWVELTGGVRVEIIKQVFVGWSIRGKFLLNAKKFTELPPYYIAGYGRGEKKSIFDFNVYIDYALRWNRKKIAAPKE